MTARERLAARDRVVEALRKADEGRYGSAWYFYVDRRDVEAAIGLASTATPPVEDDRAEKLARAAGVCCGDPGDCGGCEA